MDYQQYYLRGLADQYAFNQISAEAAQNAIDAANWPDAAAAICEADQFEGIAELHFDSGMMAFALCILSARALSFCDAVFSVRAFGTDGRCSQYVVRETLCEPTACAKLCGLSHLDCIYRDQGLANV